VTETVRKVAVASLLVLCVAIHVLELSGRWDRTLPDVNDEAGLVAVVLCVGAAMSFARTLLGTVVLQRFHVRVHVALEPLRGLSFVSECPFDRLASSPPLPLRI